MIFKGSWIAPRQTSQRSSHCICYNHIIILTLMVQHEGQPSVPPTIATFTAARSVISMRISRGIDQDRWRHTLNPLVWPETQTPPASSSAFCAHLLPWERRSTYANEQWQRYCGSNINGVITAQPALLSPPPLPDFISQPSYGSPSGGRRRQPPRSPDPELIMEAQVQALRERPGVLRNRRGKTRPEVPKNDNDRTSDD